LNAITGFGSDVILMGYSMDTLTSRQTSFLIRTDSVGFTTCNSEAINFQISTPALTEYLINVIQDPISPVNVVERNVALNAASLNVDLNNCPVGMESVYFIESSLLVYPNPSTGTFTLKADNLQFVSIANIVGKQLFNFKLIYGQVETKIHLTEPGIYLITAGNERSLFQKKVLIVK
jgi:hypothetical protein